MINPHDLLATATNLCKMCVCFCRPSRIPHWTTPLLKNPKNKARFLDDDLLPPRSNPNFPGAKSSEDGWAGAHRQTSDFWEEFHRSSKRC